ADKPKKLAAPAAPTRAGAVGGNLPADHHHPDLHPPVRRQAGDQRVAVLVFAFDHRLDAAAPDCGDPVGRHALVHQVVAHAVRAAGGQVDVGTGVADPVAVADHVDDLVG